MKGGGGNNKGLKRRAAEALLNTSAGSEDAGPGSGGKKPRGVNASSTTDGGAGAASGGAASAAEIVLPSSWSTFSSGLSMPALQAKASESLLKGLVSSLPSMEMKPFVEEVAKLQAQISAVQKAASESAAEERNAALDRLKKQLEAKDSLITALRAQTKALTERVSVDGSVPASCVASTQPYKNLLQEKEALAAEIVTLKGEMASRDKAASEKLDKEKQQAQALLAAQEAKASTRLAAANKASQQKDRMLEAMRVLTGLSIEARGSGNAGGSSSGSGSDAVLGIYAFKTEHPETRRPLAFELEFFKETTAEGEEVTTVEYFPTDIDITTAGLPQFLTSPIQFSVASAPMFLAKFTESLRPSATGDAAVTEEAEAVAEAAVPAEAAPEAAVAAAAAENKMAAVEVFPPSATLARAPLLMGKSNAILDGLSPIPLAYGPPQPLSASNRQGALAAGVAVGGGAGRNNNSLIPHGELTGLSGLSDVDSSTAEQQQPMQAQPMPPPSAGLVLSDAAMAAGSVGGGGAGAVAVAPKAARRRAAAATGAAASSAKKKKNKKGKGKLSEVPEAEDDDADDDDEEEDAAAAAPAPAAAAGKQRLSFGGALGNAPNSAGGFNNGEESYNYRGLIFRSSPGGGSARRRSSALQAMIPSSPTQGSPSGKTKSNPASGKKKQRSGKKQQKGGKKGAASAAASGLAAMVLDDADDDGPESPLPPMRQSLSPNGAAQALLPDLRMSLLLAGGSAADGGAGAIGSGRTGDSDDHDNDIDDRASDDVHDGSDIAIVASLLGEGSAAAESEKKSKKKKKNKKGKKEKKDKKGDREQEQEEHDSPVTPTKSPSPAVSPVGKRREEDDEEEEASGAAAAPAPKSASKAGKKGKNKAPKSASKAPQPDAAVEDAGASGRAAMAAMMMDEE